MVSNIESANSYIQQINSSPEYSEAQQEIFSDESLIDTTSTYETPNAYYVLPSSTLGFGTVYLFNTDGTGSIGDIDFEWKQQNGTITATMIAPEVGMTYESVEINGITKQVQVEYSAIKHELKRASSGNRKDSLFITSYTNFHYPNGEVEDRTSSYTQLQTAIKENGIFPIEVGSADTAYVPTPSEMVSQSITSNTEIITLNSDSSGDLRFSDDPFNWQNSNGILQLNFADNSTARFKKVQTGNALDLFALEASEDGINYRGYIVGQGKIITDTDLPSWDSLSVAGIYTYDNATFRNALETYWFELHTNGDAETISTNDYNEDGVLSTDEVSIWYGNWQIRDDGSLVIQRVGRTSECRYPDASNCSLNHERVWKLVAQQGNQYGLLHTHHFFSGIESLNYDNRTIYKMDAAPVDINQIATSKNVITKSALPTQHMNSKFSALEPFN